MALEIKENVSLKGYTTFKLGGEARYFTEIKEAKDVPLLFAFAKAHDVDVMPIGRGSNFVFGDGVLNKLIAKIDLLGRRVISEDDESITVQLEAGNLWDDDVAFAVDKGYTGIEAMSAIPGTTGATPIQNVGAYGQEITDTLIELDAFDKVKNEMVTLSNNDCKFSYRASIFNTTEKGRYFITSITLKLSKLGPTVPDYPGVKEYLISHGKDIAHVTVTDIREAITEIRNSKLPNPENDPNLGSFFKNPFIEKDKADAIKEEFPDAKIFPQDDGRVKISAGWLIDITGLKGKTFGNFSVYEKNALVLVHNGKGTFKELLSVRDQIIESVKNKFGITLEHEPLLIEK